MSKISFLLVVVSLYLVGCAPPPAQEWSQAAQNKQTGTGVQVKPSELGVPTKPSVEYIRIKTENSIFLDPPEGNTDVYVRIGDTSGHDWNGLELGKMIKRELKNRGFQPVRNAKNAAYVLQVNIRLADEVSAAEIAKLDETKYGSDVGSVLKSVLAGAAIGGLGAGATGGESSAVLAGAVGGAVIGGALAAITNNEKRKLILAQQSTKFFSLITDVELRERAQGVVTRSGKTNFDRDQNTANSESLSGDAVSATESNRSTQTESYTETSNWKRYRTRMLGKAKGKLVVFEDVQQDFAVKMARAIAGLF